MSEGRTGRQTERRTGTGSESASKIKVDVDFLTIFGGPGIKLTQQKRKDATKDAGQEKKEPTLSRNQGIIKTNDGILYEKFK